METATSIELFVEILDRYVYYFDQQNDSVRKTRGCLPEEAVMYMAASIIY